MKSELFPYVIPLFLCAVMPQILCLSILEHKIDPPIVRNCSFVTLTCQLDTAASDVIVWWMFRGENASQLPNSVVLAGNADKGEWKLELTCPTLDNNGTYVCNARSRNESGIVYQKKATLEVYVPVTILLNSTVIRGSIGNSANLKCAVTGNPLPLIKWYKDGKFIDANNSRFHTYVNSTDRVTVLASLRVATLKRRSNGTYTCQAKNEFSKATAAQDLLVEEPPMVEFVKDNTVIKNSSTVTVKWRVTFDGNCPIERFHLDRYVTESRNGSNEVLDHDIHGNIKEYTIRNLLPGITYTFRLCALNSVGNSPYDYLKVSMPADVPPKMSWVHLLASTNERLLFGWRQPTHDNGASINNYSVELRNHNGGLVANSTYSNEPGRRNYLYSFDNLDPGETYTFKIQPCNIVGCGVWSQPVEGTTSDGIADPPRNVEIACDHDIRGGLDRLNVTWEIPLNARGTVLNYNLTLYSKVYYRNEYGKAVEEETSKIIIIDANLSDMNYNTTVLPNTLYIVQMCTINKSGCGTMTNITVKTQCKTVTSVPSNMPQFFIRKVNITKNYTQLEIKLQRITERNGPILCYKVIIIKMPTGKNLSEFSSSPEATKLSTYREVHKEKGYGAYVADAFSSKEFVDKVIIGDNNQRNCCYNTWIFEKEKPRIQYRFGNEDESEIENVEDGILDFATNYSGFVLIEVQGPNDTVLYKTSPYFPVVLTDPLFRHITDENSTLIVISAVIGIVSVILIGFVLFIIRYRHRIQYLQNAGSLSRTALILRSIRFDRSFPFKIKRLSKLARTHPISAAELPSAFMERHAENDLLLQDEFAALPDKFVDRTTVASDAPENFTKNRYPDIKAYDQTRVKLISRENIPGSDYINANFVESYGRKKTYICSQSPLETTVEDFWRMIWENRVTVAVMLADVEEDEKYVRYWNDSVPTKLQSFMVTVAMTQKYSYYTMRRFRIENVKGKPIEERELLQFHFIPWKDSLAREHPSWLLHFIKRVNEYYSPERGPLLIICSSGVGRCGTFLAIDSLLQQLKEEGQADVFSQVYALRYQRNFLVESLEQYRFVYKALIEYVLFGDTEVDVWHLRDHYNFLKENNARTYKTGLAKEFEKLGNLIEDPKTYFAGTAAMNIKKNRYNFIIPYDMNRVLLSILNNGHHSSYINASFIESYDRSLSFIITQDPMASTIVEFWRMIKEQNISIIIMLSEIGDGQTKCHPYWPTKEEENTYGLIKVTYTSCEDFPFYTKRNFIVTDRDSSNINNSEVTQLQLREWPLNSETISASTLGLVKLIEDAQQNQVKQGKPVVVHCSGGGDRCSVFVTLSSLLVQLKTEKSVDVFQTAKYTRLQRQCMIQTLPLYDLLYRGLLEYVTSRNICDIKDILL